MFTCILLSVPINVFPTSREQHIDRRTTHSCVLSEGVLMIAKHDTSKWGKFYNTTVPVIAHSTARGTEEKNGAHTTRGWRGMDPKHRVRGGRGVSPEAEKNSDLVYFCHKLGCGRASNDSALQQLSRQY